MICIFLLTFSWTQTLKVHFIQINFLKSFYFYGFEAGRYWRAAYSILASSLRNILALFLVISADAIFLLAAEGLVIALGGFVGEHLFFILLCLRLPAFPILLSLAFHHFGFRKEHPFATLCQPHKASRALTGSILCAELIISLKANKDVSRKGGLNSSYGEDSAFPWFSGLKKESEGSM